MFLVRVGCSLAHNIRLVSQSTRIADWLATEAEALALLKASSQGTRDDELAFLAGLEAKSVPERRVVVGGHWQSTL